MKNFLTVLIIGTFCCQAVNAQQTADTTNNGRPKRHVRMNYITKDSVNVAFNDDFEMIEDSCSQIIRYTHVNRKERKFIGKIKDVSSLDTGLVLTEGTYTADGLKDGYFETHYLNSKLQAKGSFKNNLYDGRWEMYYDDGKPRVFFDANGSDIKITDAWDDKGNKIVDNGKGEYRADLGPIYWKGKLINGKPDGTWAAMKTYDNTNTELITEKYKDGTFQKGKGPLGAYTDAPRIVMVAPDMLPFTHAEQLHISRVPCDGTKRNHIVKARFGNGALAFNEDIKEVVRAYFNRVGYKENQNTGTLVLTGTITENGNIINLVADNAFNSAFVNGLITHLGMLPAFEPATVNGKPAKEKFSMIFTFERGIYHFHYHFLEVEDNN